MFQIYLKRALGGQAALGLAPKAGYQSLGQVGLWREVAAAARLQHTGPKKPKSQGIDQASVSASSPAWSMKLQHNNWDSGNLGDNHIEPTCEYKIW